MADKNGRPQKSKYRGDEKHSELLRKGGSYGRTKYEALVKWRMEASPTND